MSTELGGPSPETLEGVAGSQHLRAALNEVRKRYPEKEGQFRKILTNVDQQGVENFNVFTPSFDAGLHVPFTRVSVNKLKGIKSSEDTTSESPKRVVHIIFVGGAVPPEAVHPFIAWDIVYDRAINYIPRAASGEQVEVYSVGYPEGFGGKVTLKWIQAAAKDPIAYQNLYGEFVKGIMAENPANTHYIFQGHSIGSTFAELAARSLTEEQRKHVQLLLDDPVGNHGVKRSVLSLFQIVGGFGGVAGKLMLTNPNIRAAFADEKPFLERLKPTLTTKGINWQTDKTQGTLKWAAAMVDLFNVIKGTPLDTENIRSFVRQGIKDPLSFPSRGFFDTLTQEVRNRLSRNKKPDTKINYTVNQRSLEFAIETGHYINRFRVDKWARIVNKFLSK